jgi:hypothetical protein
LPLAFYGQWIGEDEAGGLPAKFLGLMGMETWFGTGLGTLRLRGEYANTACNFSRRQPHYDCAYRNFIYPQGYSYRGRPIGHSIDNDSRMVSFGAVLTLEDGSHASVALRRIELNRDDDGPHFVSDVRIEVDNVELRYSRGLGAGRLSLGVGYQDPVLSADSSSRVNGFVNWQQGF